MKKIKNNIKVSTVNTLVKKIQNEILEGKQRLELAVENEKTITYWKIGKHINEHLLEHNERAEYGTELFKKLSEKLGIGQRRLCK
jgi:ribosomal protein S20